MPHQILYTPKKSSLIYDVIKYGALYNWWASTDSRKITSSDNWVVLTRTQWDTLITDVGGTSIAGRELKEIGTSFWTTSGGTNTFLFNGKGGGQRTSGVFNSLLSLGTFWTSTQTIPGFARYASMSASSDATTSGGAGDDEGKSIRLICTSGNPTTYTGNDGKIYRTVTINGITYLADNLAETKYRNGDWITGYDGGTYTPISNAAWTAKTTEAMCAYADNWSNVL